MSEHITDPAKAADDGIGYEPGGCDIALVGLSGQFPGAADVHALWAALREGRSGITHFSDEELRAAGVPAEVLADPSYVKAGGVLDGIDLFDAEFFGVGPTEAQILDPQQRLFLEHSWRALEDAGCDPTRLAGTVGVFGGSAWSSYLSNNLAPAGIGAVLGDLAVGLANDKDSLTTRVAHTLGLTGPTYGVQSYCSTSLVAVCAAASSLAGMECDLALAGGVAVAVPHRVGYPYQAGGIAPPDAECRAFDAAGLGAPLGSGVGVVALRRLDDALADGDRIYAVLRGWAVNNDGGRKVGFTAPGVQGQAEVISEALSAADLDPAAIDYIEAHGTGTALGDAAELAALQQVFHGESCRIGSVKTNVGHLDRAAGVTSLIKVALALRSGEIPPTRNLRTLNPQLKTGAAHLEVVTELTAWPRSADRIRRAGVSAFGIGGTNAHVVLEEAPRTRVATGSDGATARPEILVWSARDAEAADELTAGLADVVGAGRDALADVAHTLQTGRRVFEHRRMCVATDSAGAVEALRGVGVRGRREAGTDREVVFLIAGTGEQYPGMAAGLYADEPVFRAVVDDCRTTLQDLLGHDPMTDLITPRAAGGHDAGLGWLLGRDSAAGPGLDQATDRLQPATFVVGYALARLLQEWGVRPSLLAGYSVGEYVAACLSGVLTEDQALALVAHRAQLIAALPAGGMAAVPLPADQLQERIARYGAQTLDVAAVNGPAMSVVAGPAADLERLRSALAAESLPCRPLATSHAFHSRMLEPARAELTDWVRAHIRPGAPRIPYLSNVTGRLVDAETVADPGYWAEHMCSPVRFDDALTAVLAAGDAAVLEIGPGQSLGAMLRGRPDCPRERWPLIVPSIPSAAESTTATTALAEAVGRLWLAGVPIDWAGHRGGRTATKTTVPGHPQRRQSYWIDPPTPTPTSAPAPAAPADVPAPAARTGLQPGHVALLAPTWTPLTADPVEGSDAASGPVVLLADAAGRAVGLADRLTAEGREVRLVADPDPHDELARELAGRYGEQSLTVLDLRALDRTDQPVDGPADVLPAGRWLDALGRSGLNATVVLVTAGAHRVVAPERPAAGQAATSALAVVANQEYLTLTCRTVDLDPAADSLCADIAALHRELTTPATEVHVAHRGDQRLLRGFAPATGGSDLAIRAGGTYLVTGGLGPVGLLLAGHLARRGAGRLVLTSRGGRPGPEATAALDRLRADGVTVDTPAVDVTDAEAMRTLIDGLCDDGGLHGVLHAAAQTGPATFRVLRDLDSDAVRTHFAAKVHGARTLADVLDDRPADRAPDFCLVFSSTSAVLGGLAFASYAAANAALAALAAARPTGPGRTTWLSAAWDTWPATASGTGLPAGFGATMLTHSMSVEEALDALDRALLAPAPELVLTAGGWGDRLPVLTRPELPPVPAAGGKRFPRPDLAQPYSPPLTATERVLAGIWSEVLGIEPVGTWDNFFDLSGSSLSALQMLALVKQRTGHAVPSVALFEAPTVHALAALIGAVEPTVAPVTVPAPAVPVPAVAAPPTAPQAATDRDDRIAVVGMAGRFPGADDVAQFWANVRDGVESITRFTPEQLLAAGVDPALIADPAYVPARPVLADIAGFDAGFFGMSPRMAALTDPQQRLFLEVCWEALEQSGYAQPGADRVGVYGGTNLSTYLLQMPERMFAEEGISTYEIIMGNEKDALTTTVSYLFDLRGPSVAVQTFCSTSLVATHLAVQALRSGDCELALAGGVSIRVPDHVGHRFAPGGMESPDGHVRTFDKQARGSLFGDGAAVVVLKRYADAVRDGDHVWSVIRGTAMNNDGALKVGYTAPSVVGQAAVVVAAMADAGVTGDDIGYLEAHGTATELGDPIEVAALTRAFGPTRETQSCAIGSVKTNIGHLDRAAGVTGLIKTSMALYDEVLPPSLHYTEANPDIDFEHSPFYVNTALVPWSGERARIAGLNSLGMGGTNVHVVVEQAPPRTRGPAGTDGREGRRYAVLPVSARTGTAADQACERLAAYLTGHSASHPASHLDDIAYTLQVGRKVFEHRRAVLADVNGNVDGDFNSNAHADAAAALRTGPLSRIDAARGRGVALVLPASLTLPALGEVYDAEPAFARAVDDCAALLGRDRPDLDLVAALRAGSAADGPVTLAAPVVFTARYALARTLESWGITPVVSAADGLGAVVAACRSGAVRLADALGLTTRWDVDDDAALTAWARRFVTTAAPVATYRCGLTGADATAESIADPTYWSRLRAAPTSPATAPTTFDDPELVVVTAGSGTSAELRIALLPAIGPTEPVAPADRTLAEAVARLWLAGVDVDWAAYHAEDPIRPGRVPLPTYPFQRSRYWIDREPKAAVAAVEATPGNLLAAIEALPVLPEEQWLHLPVWRQTAAPAAGPVPTSWLVLAGSGDRAEPVVAALSAAADAAPVDVVRPGTAFAVTEDGYLVRPGERADLAAVLRARRAAGRPLDRVVDLRGLHNPGGSPERESAARVADGLAGLVALAQAAADTGEAEWSFDVVVAGSHAVLPGEAMDPAAIAAVGPVLVVPLEHPAVRARLIDLPAVPDRDELRHLVAELRRPPADRIVALRHGRRWRPGFESVPTDAESTPGFRDGGVYLITGGLGGVVLGLAERLATDHQARLVLLARTGTEGEDATARRRAADVQRLRDLGAEVEIVVGDVCDPADCRRAVAVAHERFGALHGVLHAAGVPGMGLLQFKSPAELDTVLAPKVAGTLALAAALGLDGPVGDPALYPPLDFLVLFASITTATGGGPGQVDYCTANAFLDAWAADRARAGYPVLAVDWGEWQWNAWDAGLAGYDEELQAFFRRNRARVGIDAEAGWRLLNRALATGESRVVVSTQDFETVVRGSAEFTVDAVRPAAPDPGRRHPRPELTTMFTEPSGPVQIEVARTWCEALCLLEVGVADNFFELGGNSLLGVSIVAALRSEFGLTELAPHVLYEAPTVATLAAVIAAAAGTDTDGGRDDRPGGEHSQVRAQLRRSGLSTSAARRRRSHTTP